MLCCNAIFCSVAVHVCVICKHPLCVCVLQNPVTGPTAFESFQNANPIWQALNTAFLTVMSNTTSVSSTTVYFYQKIYGPLFEMFQQFPNGIFKGPMAGTPLTITTPAGELSYFSIRKENPTHFGVN